MDINIVNIDGIGIGSKLIDVILLAAPRKKDSHGTALATREATSQIGATPHNNCPSIGTEHDANINQAGALNLGHARAEVAPSRSCVS